VLHLNHQILVQAYELLRLTPPFKAWHLPEADAVEFHAVSIKGVAQAEHYVLANLKKKTEHHVIRLNPKRHHTLAAVMMTLAHEMCHMREYELGYRITGCHGAKFDELAKSVCKHHGFDRGQF
jgi:hypothetical protein